MSEENRFYVYALLDPRKPGNYKYGEYEFSAEPFYVGKGCDDRPKDHIREAITYRDKRNNKFGTPKCNKIRKIIRECSLEPTIEIIKEKCLEGNRKFYKNHPEKAKERDDRMRELAKDPVNRKKCIDGIKELWKTKEYREKMSRIEHHWSEESREKMRQLGLKTYIIIKPDGNEEECNDLSEFCKYNNLKYRTMSRIANGEIECSEKGYRCYIKGEGEKMKDFWETVYKYKCISPEGKVFKTVRLSVFCRLHGLSQECMARVSRGLYPSYRGWTVEKL